MWVSKAIADEPGTQIFLNVVSDATVLVHPYKLPAMQQCKLQDGDAAYDSVASSLMYMYCDQSAVGRLSVDILAAIDRTPNNYDPAVVHMLHKHRLSNTLIVLLVSMLVVASDCQGCLMRR